MAAYHEGWALVSPKTKCIAHMDDGQYAVFTEEKYAILKAAEVLKQYGKTLTIRRVKIPLPWSM
ncbi:hypothetical protein CPT_Merlin243 [Citrobacter phage Merlin]|uniref:Uncharacterized protein n=1 Tax=Citrobacter phage Merlin TaxID=1675602 RepID=A0A0K1LN83_9CAUD|nr:hypothetical protein CPT_Merlin243 [Citrobacter phage Merlin]AKU43889.1 hypothetical protein CPT_Merlin243 [Citrobacter phage Merlin]